MPNRLSLSFALAFVASAVAQASPARSPASTIPVPQPSIVLVAGGCGPAYHPDRFGVCVPNQRFIRLPPPCPRGYHRDPDPARPICYPNL